MTSRHPETTDDLTHGWRWYRLLDGRLMSPLAPGTVLLPRDGGLDHAFFIPRAEEMFWTAFQIHHEKWYDFALTFGAVQGPFARDHTMPRVGSMQSTRYQARAIVAFTVETAYSLHPNYDIPIAAGDFRRGIRLFREVKQVVMRAEQQHAAQVAAAVAAGAVVEN